MYKYVVPLYFYQLCSNQVTVVVQSTTNTHLLRRATARQVAITHVATIGDPAEEHPATFEVD